MKNEFIYNFKHECVFSYSSPGYKKHSTLHHLLLSQKKVPQFPYFIEQYEIREPLSTMFAVAHYRSVNCIIDVGEL